MIKNIVVVLVAIFVAAYFLAPDSLKPWKDVASHTTEVSGNIVRSAGESVNKAIRDEAHKDSLVDKTKDRIGDAATGK
jgi:hypothetical protein